MQIVMQKFDSVKFANDKATNISDLENELAQNPNKLGFYGEWYARWNAEVERQKVLRDAKAGEIAKDLRDSGIKHTAVLITAEIETDKEYIQIMDSLNDAIEQRELFSMAVNALRAKQSSLGSLNAIARTEFNATTTNVASSTPEERASRRERVVASQG